jgi:hypothetical protein
MIRRAQLQSFTLALIGFLFLIAPAFAQVPAAVPALPDAERRTSYSITATNCSCAVNMALFGDGTDFANWVEVFINGVRYDFNDASRGWTITSPSGSLANLARPITNAVLTFNAVQTGTVQIVGARRPRRTAQFAENAGVPARNINQVVTDITATLREMWDKNNDMTGRGLFSQPGNTMGPMPLPAACSGKYLGFDVTGLIPQCNTGGPGSGNVVGPGSSTDGDFAVFSGASGAIVKDAPSTVIQNATANRVWAGPGSGIPAAPAFRALVGADLPNPGASSLGGVQSLTCSTSNWFNTLSTGGVLGCSQPNFTNLAGSISAGQIPAGTIVDAAISASAAITLSKLATQAANTAVANVTSGSAVPTAAALPSCSAATSALSYTSGTGFGCQTFGTVVAQSYSQGTWTPGLQGTSAGNATYTTQVGSYEQIGRHITARFKIVTASVASMTGSVQLTGLPFTVANTANDYGGCFVTEISGYSLSAGFIVVTFRPIANTTTADQLEMGGTTVNAVAFGSGQMTATTTVSGTCEYHT